MPGHGVGAAKKGIDMDNTSTTSQLPVTRVRRAAWARHPVGRITTTTSKLRLLGTCPPAPALGDATGDDGKEVEVPEEVDEDIWPR